MIFLAGPGPRKGLTVYPCSACICKLTGRTTGKSQATGPFSLHFLQIRDVRSLFDVPGEVVEEPDHLDAIDHIEFQQCADVVPVQPDEKSIKGGDPDEGMRLSCTCC